MRKTNLCLKLEYSYQLIVWLYLKLEFGNSNSSNTQFSYSEFVINFKLLVDHVSMHYHSSMINDPYDINPDIKLQTTINNTIS